MSFRDRTPLVQVVLDEIHRYKIENHYPKEVYVPTVVYETLAEDFDGELVLDGVTVKEEPDMDFCRFGGKK